MKSNRILTIMLAFCLVLSFCPAAFADSAVVSMSSGSGAPGETVTLSVFLNEAFPEGFTSLRFYISFDEESLTFVSAEKGEATQDAVSVTGMARQKVVIIDYGDTAFTGTGEIAKLNFTVNEGVELKEYEIGFNNNRWSVQPDASVTATGGTVTVTSPNPVPTSTIKGTLRTDKSEYSCGDTVKVTAKLTPDAAAKLSSGSLKFEYDTDKLKFISAEVNPTLTNGKATLFQGTSGTCVASFTSEGDAMDVTTDGLVLADFSFEAIKDGTAEFPVLEAVAADEKATAYTTQTGDSLSVIIQALPEVTTVDYGSDYKMVKYVADALPEEGNAYFIGDTALTCVPAYATGDDAGKYVFVMLSKDEPVDQTVTTKAGSYGTVTATGDANGDTRTNIIDAQVVYYMTTSKITSSDSGYDWLNSDVNGSCTLDALDAHAIQYFVHYGKFGQFSS